MFPDKLFVAPKLGRGWCFVSTWLSHTFLPSLGCSLFWRIPVTQRFPPVCRLKKRVFQRSGECSAGLHRPLGDALMVLMTW